MYFWRDCPENYWCYRSLHLKHLFQALSHKNMVTHFVHEVLWDKGFRINTLVQAPSFKTEKLSIQNPKSSIQNRVTTD